MDEPKETLVCLNCARSDREVPLVSLRYSGNQAWICSQCLPVLIHHSERLTSKLAHVVSGGASPGDLDQATDVSQP